MGESAAHAVFGYYTAALAATACIALTSGVQFLLIGLRRRGQPMFLSYAMLCLCIAVLSLANAVLGLSQDTARSIAAIRVMCGAAAVYFPAFVVFTGHYTGRPVSKRFLTWVTALAGVFFVLNLLLPGTLLFSQVSGIQEMRFAWGEWISKLNGVPSPIGWTFHLLTYVAFGWALSRVLRQFRRQDRLAAMLLGGCLLLQFGALLWGDVVVDLMGTAYPYVDSFSFITFVLLMGLSMATQLHRRNVQLEHTTQRLHEEAETRKEAELSLRYLAFHDSLTGLPNRLRVLEQISLLRQEEAPGAHSAVMVIDLDNFKTINDALGYRVGDRMLEMAADRLVAAAPAESVVGRLGGDEFVVVLPALSASAEVAGLRAQRVASDLCQRLAAPISIDQRVLAVGASIGLSLFSSSDTDAADVIRRADIALYRAKAAGRNTVRTFEAQMQGIADERLELERGLRSALESLDTDAPFRLFFQPQVGIDGSLRGAEALLRWSHPTLGEVSPSDFIPIAEQTGLIHTLGAWVIAQTCECMRVWDAAGLDVGGHIAVNVSAWQIAHPDFVRQVENQLHRAGIAPSRITLELTESALLQDFDAAMATMRALAEIGFRLSLDDFGTGYSSLSHLRQLPLHELKIDRSFISSLGGAGISSPLAGFIIDVARRLGMSTVAEGVETPAQRALLEAMGCDVLQGYLICPPVPAPEFVAWLQQRASTSVGALQG